MNKLHLACCLLLFCLSGCIPKYYVSLKNETCSDLFYIRTTEQGPYLIQPNSFGSLGAVYGSDLLAPSLLKIVSKNDTLKLEYSEIQQIVDSLWMKDKYRMDIVVTEEWFSSQLKKRSKVEVLIKD